MTNDEPRTHCPTTALDWRQIRVGDPVWEVPADLAPETTYAFKARDGRIHRAAVDAKSAVMGERHLMHWSRAGVCTTTLAEARRIIAGRGR